MSQRVPKEESPRPNYEVRNQAAYVELNDVPRKILQACKTSSPRSWLKDDRQMNDPSFSLAPIWPRAQLHHHNKMMILRQLGQSHLPTNS